MIRAHRPELLGQSPHARHTVRAQAKAPRPGREIADRMDKRTDGLPEMPEMPDGQKGHFPSWIVALLTTSKIMFCNT